MSEEKKLPPDVEPATEAEATVSVPTSNWWSPWLDVAKSKSAEVYEFVKKDLSEITTVVKSEASAAATALKETLNLEEPESAANTVKRSVSSFLDSVNNVLNPLPEDEGEEALLIQNDTPVPLSRFQTRLFEIIKNPETFTKPIDDGQKEEYESWLAIGDELLTMDKLTKLLVASPDLHRQYEDLVPAQVANADFWKRYLFRKALLEDEESLREHKERTQVAKVQWEKEDFAQGLDLSEEEQMKILADYEKEKKGNETADLVATEQPKKISSEELIMKERQGMVVVGESSLESTGSSSADSESKDTDEWEKLDDTEAPSK